MKLTNPQLNEARTEPHLTVTNGFPGYRLNFVNSLVGCLSWRQRLPDMKFPADPESRRAWTGREMSEAVSNRPLHGIRHRKI